MSRRPSVLLLISSFTLGVVKTTSLNTDKEIQVQSGEPFNVTLYNINQGTPGDSKLNQVYIDWQVEEHSRQLFECTPSLCHVPDNVKLLVDRTVVIMDPITKAGTLTSRVSYTTKHHSVSTIKVVVVEPAKKPEPKSITDAPAQKKPHTNGRVRSLGSTIGTDFVCLFVTLSVGLYIRLAN